MQAEIAASPINKYCDKIQLSKPNWVVCSKLVGDFIVAAILLLLTWPLILLSALLVWLTSPGPVIYSQTRLGRNGKYFKIYKIRTMIHNCERFSGPRWSVLGDPRITPVGKFLRHTHLDELPQLLNVLRGEMSLIGPRPERPEFADKLAKAIPLYRCRLMVRPGVTGLAQVQLPPDTDLDGVRRKLAYDLYYIQNLSFFRDCRILLATVLKVFGARFVTLHRYFRFPSLDAVEQNLDRLTAAEEPGAADQPEFQLQPAQV
jgi:lipopolysaccharide/colanic/teichoic acid biosynthesis glycosyltransferase